MSAQPRFAALTQRVHRAVFAHLCDAQALLDGEPLTGLFDDPAARGDVGIGMAGTQPSFTVPAGALRCSPVGLLLTMLDDAYTAWRVADAVPDGAGVVRLVLERP